LITNLLADFVARADRFFIDSFIRNPTTVQNLLVVLVC